jgi:CRISPR system Cascade subunit CasA
VVGRKEKVNGKEVVFRSGKAAGAFYKRLGDILPRTADAVRSEGEAA